MLNLLRLIPSGHASNDLSGSKMFRFHLFLWRAVDGEEEVKPEQLRAAEIIARMTGWNEPEKVEHSGVSEIVIRRL